MLMYVMIYFINMFFVIPFIECAYISVWDKLYRDELFADMLLCIEQLINLHTIGSWHSLFIKHNKNDLPFCFFLTIVHIKMFQIQVVERSLKLSENLDWGCLTTGCWKEYLYLRGLELQEGGKTCVIWSSIIWIHYQILLRWSNQGGVIGSAGSAQGRR